MHYKYNNIEYENLDLIQKRGSKYIDSIVTTETLFNFVEGCKLFEFDEVVATDYRLYVIDINLE